MPRTNEECCRDYRKRKRENKIIKKVKSATERVREYRARRKALLNMQNGSFITYNDDFTVQNSESVHSSEKKMENLHKSINPGNATYVDTKIMIIKQEHSSYETANLDTKPTILPVEFQYNALNIQDTNKCDNSEDIKDVNYDRINVKKEVLSDDSDTDTVLPVSVEVKDSNAQSIKREEITIACSICFMEFTNEYEYNEHVHVQAETGPGRKERQPIPNAASYKCNTCGKELRTKATYKAHMRFHTSNCVCESCGKHCRNNNQLQEHKRARHGLGRIHKCAYCEYSSATKEALTIHERRHTGERPYVCDHCGATFHRRSNLVQHIAIHLPEKNFQCDMCPKRLKSRKLLQIHKHNAHTGKRYGYLCSICEHRFEKPNKVRAHARRVHALADEQLGPIVRVQI